MVNHSFKFTPLLLALASTPIMANTEAGKTIITRGDVTAHEQAQTPRSLKRRSPIFNVDTVNTLANSKAQFRMSDGSLLAVKENSQVNIAQYNYQDGADNNSMVIELVKGGLRSVTGAIKENSGSYELKTPVGSIGIRGTHFEIELVEGEMFLAVWDGAIDLTVDTGTGTDTVSFGEGEDFSFGVISQEGEVTELLQPPENFQTGHSDDDSSEVNEDPDNSDDPDDLDGNSTSNGNSESNADEDQADSQSTSNTGNEDQQPDSTNNIGGESSNADPDGQLTDGLQTDSAVEPSADNTPTGDEQDIDESLGESLNQETFDSLTPTAPEIVAAMQGTTTLSGVIDSSVESSAGAVSNFSVNMNINFDTTFVEGDLTATDAGGEWFAVYQGFIDQNQLSLGISQATHGNELATGQIGGFFTDQASKVFGNFNLSELNNPNNTISGNFLLE